MGSEISKSRKTGNWRNTGIEAGRIVAAQSAGWMSARTGASYGGSVGLGVGGPIGGLVGGVAAGLAGGAAGYGITSMIYSYVMGQ